MHSVETVSWIANEFSQTLGILFHGRNQSKQETKQKMSTRCNDEPQLNFDVPRPEVASERAGAYRWWSAGYSSLPCSQSRERTATGTGLFPTCGGGLHTR